MTVDEYTLELFRKFGLYSRVKGFIIVAACVMTFEARDSAAKVGPAGMRLVIWDSWMNINECLCMMKNDNVHCL